MIHDDSMGTFVRRSDRTGNLRIGYRVRQHGERFGWIIAVLLGEVDVTNTASIQSRWCAGFKAPQCKSRRVPNISRGQLQANHPVGPQASVPTPDEFHHGEMCQWSTPRRRSGYVAYRRL